jgi:Amt family ammonium transporter
MNALPFPPLSESRAAICFFCILLIPCALGGLALMGGGLCRSRNVAHSLVGAMCVTAVASVSYFLVGAAWQGSAGHPAHSIRILGVAWDWIGAEPFLLRGVEKSASNALPVAFGFFAVALAAIIPLGAAAERWRLSACCVSTAMFACVTYPLFAHWTWGGGWLAQLGRNFHLGDGFIDRGGGAVVQAAGGLTALAIVWIIGPRQGKYDAEGLPTAMPAHNAAFVLYGCFFAWLGYLGLNCAGAILFGNADFAGLCLVPVTATLAAGSAVLAAAWVARKRLRVVDASICANAWIAGLVASSAGCLIIRPAGAIPIGLVAGTLVVFTVEWLELHLRVDDPGGVISVHAVNGVWGLLALVPFSPAPDQWLAQLVGIATLIGFVLPFSYASNWLLDRMVHFRAASEAERRGLDLSELGAGAYPDFMIHDDF